MKISINHISKSFQKTAVLQDISLEVADKSIHCLLGSSGSGKTTLLRILMGALTPDAGSVSIDAVKVPDKALLSRIGFMPQQDGLYAQLSIEDNLKFFAGIYGLDHTTFLKSSNELLEIVNLYDERKKIVANCSGGMKKRVSLICAFIHQPDLIILDEPTVGIDPLLRKQIWDYLHAQKETGKTILITTHVMDEAEKCDYASFLRNGKIIITDTIPHLVENAKNDSLESYFFLKGEH